MKDCEVVDDCGESTPQIRELERRKAVLESSIQSGSNTLSTSRKNKKVCVTYNNCINFMRFVNFEVCIKKIRTCFHLLFLSPLSLSHIICFSQKYPLQESTSSSSGQTKESVKSEKSIPKMFESERPTTHRDFLLKEMVRCILTSNTALAIHAVFLYLLTYPEINNTFIACF
jgi:hypothetical protein